MRYPRRDVVDAIRYAVRTGCHWDALPVEFPPHPLVKHYFTTRTRDGTLGRIHHSLREQVRQVEGRTADPSAALLDSRLPSPNADRRRRGMIDSASAISGRSRGHLIRPLPGESILSGVISGAGRSHRTLSAGFGPEAQAKGAVTVLILSVPFALCGLLCVLDGILGLTDGMRWTHGSDAPTPTAYKLLLGMVFLLPASWLGWILAHRFRSGAWLTGSILTVRGAFRARSVDLSTAAAVQVINRPFPYGGRLTMAAHGLMLTAVPADGKRVVNLPLRSSGSSGPLLPPAELLDLAGAAAHNPRAAQAVHQLRQLAASPITHLL